MHHAFLEGCAIGLAYAVPIGPIAVICLHRTLSANWLSGIASGLGSATASTMYSSIVLLGASLLKDGLSNYHTWLHLLSGLFLCYLGFRIALLQPSQVASLPMPSSYGRCYSTTFGLALLLALPDLTFPTLILNQLSHLHSINIYRPINFSVGMFMSEFSWWLIFCSLCCKLKFYLNFKVLRWINYVSGSVIIVLGSITILKLLSP